MLCVCDSKGFHSFLLLTIFCQDDAKHDQNTPLCTGLVYEGVWAGVDSIQEDAHIDKSISDTF